MKKDRSILLSRAVLFVFFAMLLALDIFCVPACTWFAGKSWSLSKNIPLYRWLLAASVYALSVPAYIAMLWLHRLLRNLERGEMFTAETTSSPRVEKHWFIIVIPADHSSSFSSSGMPSTVICRTSAQGTVKLR